MRVRIKDVAKIAGVSTATVSRVINSNSSISTETAEHVKKVMKELNYVPNSIARGFSNKKTYNIALIIDVDHKEAFSNPFFAQIQYGIEQIICNEGYNLIIANENSMINGQSALQRIISERRADGIIFPEILLKKAILNQLVQEKIPFVVIGNSDTFNMNCVDINNKMAGYVVTDHLINNGYQRIAFVAGSFDDKFNVERLKGYKMALEEYDAKLIVEQVATKEEGYCLIEQWHEQEMLPDSIVFSNNIAAYGAMLAIKKLGYCIPHDIGIVSFDNYPIAELTDPQMTTVDINVFELGIQAAKIVLDEIERESISKTNSLLSVKLITRGSAEK